MKVEYCKKNHLQFFNSDSSFNYSSIIIKPLPHSLKFIVEGTVPQNFDLGYLFM